MGRTCAFSLTARKRNVSPAFHKNHAPAAAFYLLLAEFVPRCGERSDMDVTWNARQPYLMLVDDDVHSARLLTRMLLAHGAPSIEWVEDSAKGLSQIKSLLNGTGKHIPGLVIVDLKSSSTAASDFIAEIAGLERSRALVIAALAPNSDRATRDALLDAGADAVFERHAELTAYRAEAAAIVSFWVRNQRLDAVGT